METTNELHRGNLVKVDGEIYQVFSVDSCFVGLSEIGEDEPCDNVDVMRVEGIKLTDNLLLKCRFEEKDENQYYMVFDEHHSIGVGSFLVNNHKDGVEGEPCSRFGIDEIGISESITPWICDDNYDHMLFIPMKYLHQLQNIYFSLINEELEIKL